MIEYFNKAAVDLPDHTRLKSMPLPGMSTVLDGKGQRYADIFEPGNRRVWVPLTDIPDYVQKAFVPPKTSRSFSITASTSAASSARSSAIWRSRAGRRVARPLPSRS